MGEPLCPGPPHARNGIVVLFPVGERFGEHGNAVCVVPGGCSVLIARVLGRVRINKILDRVIESPRQIKRIGDDAICYVEIISRKPARPATGDTYGIILAVNPVHGSGGRACREVSAPTGIYSVSCEQIRIPFGKVVRQDAALGMPEGVDPFLVEVLAVFGVHFLHHGQNELIVILVDAPRCGHAV